MNTRSRRERKLGAVLPCAIALSIITATSVRSVRAADTVSGDWFGANNGWDSGYTEWQAWKADHSFPITIGAHNWVHVNDGGPLPTGYGTPGLRGTYFWFVDFDPSVALDTTPVSSIGAHSEFRFRESSDKFRSYFQHPYWFYEAYGFADTPIGRFKAGQIWKRFGLDWDGSWWGDVQYFDGLKLDTAYGVSWENTWKPAPRLRIDSFAQFFGAEANISGSLVGANTQSVPGSHERNIGVLRLVPTWAFDHGTSLAVGVSGLAGRIRNKRAIGGDTKQTAWAADLTYTWDRLSVFGEVDRSYGILNHTRYTSGGPSHEITDTLIGFTFTQGPITYRSAWSAGTDANPMGHQHIWVPGVTVALAKGVNLYAEYVRWEVVDRFGRHSDFEHGIQLVLNWHI